MSTDTEERLNKILKYGGAGLLALLILGVFAWRLDLAQRRAATAEKELASLRAETGKVKLEPNPATVVAPVNPDAVTKSRLIGKWECREADGTTRTLAFNLNGAGEYYVQWPTKEYGLAVAEGGPWDVQGDICYIDIRTKEMDTYYLRIVRLTQEKLVVRGHNGIERPYERVK
jgi:hypothetical protein